MGRGRSFCCAAFARCLFLLAAILTLLGCGGSGSGESSARSVSQVIQVKGSAILIGVDSNTYSYGGGVAKIFGIEKSSIVIGKREVPLGTSSVAPDGTVSIALDATSIKNDGLYVVEFGCAKEGNEKYCDNRPPLRVVLSGERLKAGAWKATILTEIAYRRIGYYAAAGYSLFQMKQLLNDMAKWLFVQRASDNERQYEDILLWDPEADDAFSSVKRADFLHELSKLIVGLNTSDPALVDGLMVSLIDFIINSKIDELAGPYIENVSISIDPIAITLSGDYAYMAKGDQGISIFDISRPEKLQNLSALDTPGFASAIVISGQYAYVAAGNKGLQIVDIVNPSQPVLVGSLDTAGIASSITIAGEYLYLADGDYGIKIINISDPAHPVLVSRLDTPGSAKSVTVFGEYLFLADGTYGGVLVFDVQKPDKPVLYRRLLAGWSIQSVSVSETGFAIAASHSGVAVLNLKDMENPGLVAYLDITGKVRSLVLSGDYAYVRVSQCNSYDCLMRPDVLQVIDLRNLFKPTLVNSYLLEGGGTSLAVANGYAYVTKGMDPYVNLHERPWWFYADLFSESGQNESERYNGPRLQVIDMRAVSDPPLVGSLRLTQLRDSIVLDEQHAYLVDGYDLVVVDISNPAWPAEVGRYRGAVALDALALVGDLIYGLSFAGGLYVLDVQNPIAPALIGQLGIAVPPPQSIPLADSAGALAVQGSLVFVAVNGLFHVIDVSVASDPILVASLENLSTLLATSIELFGNYAYVVRAGRVLEVVDITNPVNPQLVGAKYIQNSPMTFAVTVPDRDFFDPGTSCGLAYCELTAPEGAALKLIPLPYRAASDVALAGNYAYAIRFGRLFILTIGFPDKGTMIGFADTIGYPFSVKIKDSEIYAATSFGLEILKALP